MSLFISYASADQSLAMEVCALLEARGVACWIAPRDVAPGAKWDEALMRAIDDCGAFLVLLSAASNDSPFVQNEVNRAFAKKKAIFTFRLDEVQPSGSLEFYLARHHWIDGFPEPIETKVAQLAAAVAAIVPVHGSFTDSAVPVSLKRRRLGVRVSLPKVIALVAVSVLATAATMLGLQSWRTGSPEAMSPPLVRFPIVLPPDQPLNRPGFHDLAVSPDGSKIVYSAGRQLYLRRIGEMEAQPIQGTASSTFGPVSPTFSPNGEWVAFAPDSNLGIAKVNVAGGAPLQLTKEGQTASLSWEGDDILFDQVGTGIQRIPAKGGAVETLVPVRLPETAFAPHRVGNIVIFTVTDATGINRWDHANVVAYRLDTKERSVLVTGASDARYLPTGHLVYAQAGLLMAAPFDIDRLSVTGAAKPVVEGVARSDQPEGSRGGAARYSIGSNGVLAYVPGPTRGVVSPNMVALVDLTGGVRLLDFPPGYYTHPRVSPDGKRLAVSSITGGAIWIYDLDSRQPPRPLTFGSLDRFPIWTPDSQDVTFQSNREGDVAVWRQRADGSARAVRVTSAEGAESHEPESWSPDGKVLTVYFGGQGIWTTTGGNARLMRLIDAVGIEKHSSFSPDGHLLAYAMIASGVFVEPFPLSGAKYQVGPAGTRTPAWSRDGKHLFMHRAATNEILVSDVEPGAVPRFGAPRPLPIKGTIHPQNQRNFDVMPDGQHLVVILPADNTAPGTVTAAQQINVVVNWFEELKRLVPVK